MTRILAVIFLAVCVQVSDVVVLACLAIMLLLANLRSGVSAFLHLLKRSRWLLLLLVLVYAWATPGEFVPDWPFTSGPTYEGLESGLLQAGRLIVMLAAIAWLLADAGRDELVAGLYQLLSPLRRCGLSPERFSVRLWLTLHYVERDPGTIRWRGWESFLQAEGADLSPESAVTLHIRSPQPVDWISWLAMCVIALWLVAA